MYKLKAHLNCSEKKISTQLFENPFKNGTTNSIDISFKRNFLRAYCVYTLYRTMNKRM